MLNFSLEKAREGETEKTHHIRQLPHEGKRWAGIDEVTSDPREWSETVSGVV